MLLGDLASANLERKRWLGYCAWWFQFWFLFHPSTWVCSKWSTANFVAVSMGKSVCQTVDLFGVAHVLTNPHSNLYGRWSWLMLADQLLFVAPPCSMAGYSRKVAWIWGHNGLCLMSLLCCIITIHKYIYIYVVPPQQVHPFHSIIFYWAIREGYHIYIYIYIHTYACAQLNVYRVFMSVCVKV